VLWSLIAALSGVCTAKKAGPNLRNAAQSPPVDAAYEKRAIMCRPSTPEQVASGFAHEGL
jgi:hypothetical protein